MEVVLIIVAIQKGLEEIKEALESRGYEVVDAESYGYPIDAIIYKGSSFQVSYISRNNMPTMGLGIRPNYGVMIINARDKSVDEIEDMLKTRYYSPLF
ncbi:MAG: YkuS family protein [Acetivibrionales bacterium]|jgi:hypothetical protein